MRSRVLIGTALFSLLSWPAAGQEPPVADASAAPAGDVEAAPAGESADVADPMTEDGVDAEVDGEAPATDVALPPVELLDVADAGPAYLDLAVKRRVIPLFPHSLSTAYEKEIVRCEADVRVNHRGKPTRVAMVDCPPGFEIRALSAIRKWKFDKPEEGTPEEIWVVRVRTGFLLTKKRWWYPAFSSLVDPAPLTGELTFERPLLKKGDMPEYPEQIESGTPVCEVDLVVTKRGRTKDIIINGCPYPYHKPVHKALGKWTWYPAWSGGEPVETELTVPIAFHI